MCKNSMEELLAEMDEVGVEKVVMCAQKIWSQRDFGLMVNFSTELVAENMKKANGKIVGGVVLILLGILLVFLPNLLR